MRKFMVTIEGKNYEVGVEEISGTENSSVATPVVTTIAKAPIQEVKKTTTSAVNGTKLDSPMPGMIVGFKVENGATVKKDQVVLVLEAMKMENDITSPCEGVVNFQVSKGANVDTGALLAIIS